MSQLSSVLPASDARANFYQILAEASDELRQFTIKLRGKNNVVIMSEEEVEGWKETLDILSNKSLTTSLNKALKSKKTYTQAEVDKMLGW